ncbi:MAG TPA: UPF0147 family protein [Thermoplasmata archaeon]|nr:UPF0147 family protein [Thermoplasmata archaeon]
MSEEAPALSAIAGSPSLDRPSTSAPVPGWSELLSTLLELSEDLTVPKNVRRGALAAKAELERRSAAVDVRIAGAVYRLDELANDPNLPVHGRTAIWSIISRLESIQ